MRKTFFEKTLNLLYGSSFAMIAVGFISTYFLYHHHSFFISLFFAFLGALPGIVLYILCEIGFLSIEKKKILEDIAQKLSHH